MLALALLLLFGCGIALIIFGLNTANIQRYEALFCTPEDDLFQVIKANRAEWMNYFFDIGLSNPALTFEARGGQRYIAIAGERPWRFHVTTEYDFPRRTSEGQAGYIYMADGSSPNWGDRFEVTPMSDNIWCFRRK